MAVFRVTIYTSEEVIVHAYGFAHMDNGDVVFCTDDQLPLAAFVHGHWARVERIEE